MLEFTKITMKNFLSVGNVEQVVSLDRKGLTLILGENLDQPQGDNSARNGVGKTTIVNGISYALYGHAISPIRRVGNFVNNINNKQSLVTLEFQKKGHTYRVERGQKPKIFRWIVDGVVRASDNSEEIVKEVGDQQGTGKDTQEAIDTVVGIDFEMFKHVVAMNTYTAPFLMMKPTEQREIIEQILGIKLLSEKAETIMELMRNSKREIESEENKIEAIKAANDKIQTSIDDLMLKVQRWDTTQHNTIAEIEGNLSALSGIDFDAEVKAFDDQDIYDRAIQALKADRDVITQEIRQIETEATRLLAEIKELETSSGVDEQQVTRLQNELDRYQRDLDQLDTTVAAQVERTERQCEEAIARINTQTETAIGRVGATLEATKVSTATRTAALQEELTKAEAELSDPDSKNCKACGQALKDEAHIHDVIERIETRITTIKTEMEKHHTQLINEIARSGNDITKLEMDRDREIKQIQSDTKAVVSKLKGETISTQMDLERRIGEVTQQIAEVKAIAETAAKVIADKITEKNAQAELIGSVLSEKHAILADKEAAITGLGVRPTSIFPTRNDAYQAKALFEQFTRDLATEKAKLNPYTEQAETLQKNLTPPRYDRLNELTRLLDHQKFLKDLLVDKKSFIRKKIIDQNLNFLNTRLANYLSKIGLPHQVTFHNDLTAEINQYGRELDIGNLSRGEGTRLSIALSLAFRDIWENLNGPINILLCDEIIDAGLDTQGSEMAFNILKEMGRDRNKCIMLVTHREELQTRSSHILIARKENKFTTFED
jgi:DNA repair exonuclease SbcCD ATPase subunit